MSRYTGPRLRIMRALGVNLPGLSAKTIEKRPNVPGQHGPRLKRKPSLHAQKLHEKQKLRFHYGLTERQLSRLAWMAARSKAPTGTALAELLERRIDNLVFRAGFARTIPAARQLVCHGHVTMNGRVLDIPSARLRRGNVVAIRDSARNAVALQQAKGTTLERPAWLDVDPAALTARLVALPDETAIPFPVEMGLVVEFYS